MDASLPGRLLILQSAPVYLLFTQASDDSAEVRETPDSDGKIDVWPSVLEIGIVNATLFC